MQSMQRVLEFLISACYNGYLIACSVNLHRETCTVALNKLKPRTCERFDGNKICWFDFVEELMHRV